MLAATRRLCVTLQPPHGIDFTLAPTDALAAVRRYYNRRWFGIGADYLSLQPPSREFLPFYLCSGSVEGVFYASVDYTRHNNNNSSTSGTYKGGAAAAAGASTTYTETVTTATQPLHSVFGAARTQLYAGYTYNATHVERVLCGEDVPLLLRPMRSVDTSDAVIRLFEQSTTVMRDALVRRVREQATATAMAMVRPYHPDASHIRIHFTQLHVTPHVVTPAFLPCFVVKAQYDGDVYTIYVSGTRRALPLRQQQQWWWWWPRRHRRQRDGLVTRLLRRSPFPGRSSECDNSSSSSSSDDDDDDDDDVDGVVVVSGPYLLNPVMAARAAGSAALLATLLVARNAVAGVWLGSLWGMTAYYLVYTITRASTAVWRNYQRRQRAAQQRHDAARNATGYRPTPTSPRVDFTDAHTTSSSSSSNSKDNDNNNDDDAQHDDDDDAEATRASHARRRAPRDVHGYYALLELRGDASVAEIRNAYRRKVLALHPDVTGDASSPQMTTLNEAYCVLRDPARRAAYDAL